MPVTAHTSPDHKGPEHFLVSKQKLNQRISIKSRGTSGKGRTAVITDEELKQLVAEALLQTQEPALAELQVSTRLGVVSLHGQVPNKDLKLLAITTAMSVGGTWLVLNCAEVSICTA
jgi:osmotically-inducible protein OsmY